MKRKLWLFALLLSVLAASAVQAQNAAVTITVDRQLNRHPISPDIYGCAGIGWCDTATLADLNCPLFRQGGSLSSSYNWKINAFNFTGWQYYESISVSTGSAGDYGDTAISLCQDAGAQAMLTIPMMGWVANLGPNRQTLYSFSIAKYGKQTDCDWSWFPDAGNGILASNGQNVVNDPNDAYMPADVPFQMDWVKHLISAWGLAKVGGLRYYILDNEYSCWWVAHPDVHPIGPTMDEIYTKMINYGTAIKDLDPSALVVGPEEWGWGGYFCSGYDLQYGTLHGLGNAPDRVSHGGWDYLPWLLNQMRLNDQNTGRRVLDVFSLHYYPQSGEINATFRGPDDLSPAMQQLRNRSTRSLWDPTYTDESWINAVVALIPRMKSWVNTYYPGTKIAVTEYSWGADAHINGATAQADILGIFGREGLDMATRWVTPDPSTPTYKAIKMYRNYDGAKSTFGEASVSATAPNPDSVAAFAAERLKDGALTIMVISKYLSGQTPVSVNLANFSKSGKASVWQLTAQNTITRLPDIPFSTGSLGAVIPSQSITMFVVKPTAGISSVIDLLLGG